MGIRKQPFGYQIRFGMIVTNPPEAETVCWIFERYAAGFSYRKLVDALAERGVPYDEGKPWNKNMAARILADGRYIGTNGYPAIVTPEQFRCAAANRPETGTLAEENSAVKAIRPLVRCADCGDRLQRRTNNIGYERWICPSCEGAPGRPSTPMLAASILALLNGLIQNPGQLRPPAPAPITAASRRLQAELDRAMSIGAEDFDGVKAQTLAFSLASARFEELGSGDCETHRLQRAFAHRTPSTELDAVLLRETVAAILVDADGKVNLKLKNEQTVGREPSI